MESRGNQCNRKLVYSILALVYADVNIVVLRFELVFPYINTKDLYCFSFDTQLMNFKQFYLNLTF